MKAFPTVDPNGRVTERVFLHCRRKGETLDFGPVQCHGRPQYPKRVPHNLIIIEEPGEKALHSYSYYVQTLDNCRTKVCQKFCSCLSSLCLDFIVNCNEYFFTLKGDVGSFCFLKQNIVQVRSQVHKFEILNICENSSSQ